MARIWFERSSDWRTALEESLKNHDGDDLLGSYREVAFAFPSEKPNEHSFEYPLIDKDALFAWAEKNNLTVKKAPEMATEKEKHHPPIRFIRKSAKSE